MRLNFKYKVFSVICCLFLMSSFVFAQSDSAQKNTINFPEVEGWEKGDIAR